VIAAIIGLIGTLLTAVVSVWIAFRRDEPQQPSQPDRPAPNVTPRTDEPPRLRPSNPPETKRSPQRLTLDEILVVLERHHQRATFGAVASILETDPRSLFVGYSRTPRTAWIVNKGTGLPTGTKERDYPPGLLQNKHVIDAPDELRAWLGEHRSEGD
jgi:hypothetical protein